jgi:thiol-disulfide isomerase/thioredoxin
MKTNKLLTAAVLATAVGASIAGFVGEMQGQSMTSSGVRVPFLHGFPVGPMANQGELASLERATEWLNSPPLTPSALQGKAVLIDFWTYTCINWRRTLPYVRAWADKYKDQGLVVIGIHAPEFAFEKNLNNVRWAVKDMGINYPVVLDNDHALWRAFRNQLGRRCFSSMRRAASAIISARAPTNSRKWSSRRCCARPEPPASAASRFR